MTMVVRRSQRDNGDMKTCWWIGNGIENKENQRQIFHREARITEWVVIALIMMENTE